ncbi:hypothetical protein Dimus_003563, partial [Dionaea muscipula]
SSEAPKKVVRTKRTKKATSEVADVGEEEAPTEGTVGGTQETEVVASKSKPKPKIKPKKKAVISPVVGGNVVGEVEGDDEGDKVEKAGDADLQVRTRRRLRKATFVPVPETRDSEETELDENVQRIASDSGVNKEEYAKKRRQKQVARTGPAAKKAKTDKEKVPLVETEPTKEPVVAGSPTIEELNQQVDELLTCPFISEAVDEGEFEDQVEEKGEEEVMIMNEEEEEEEGEGDVGSSASERRYRRWSLFSPKRLSVPPNRMIRECMDVMMGSANRATIRTLCKLPLRHKCAILCRNMAETSLLTGDVLCAAVQIDDRRCRNIDRLMEEKYALEHDIEELKFERDSAIEISSQVKADVEMVMEENQLLEKENEELKSTLEGEKKKVQTLEHKIKELQTALGKEKKEEEREKELVASYKKHQELLHKKMDLDTSLYERK